MNKSQKRIRKIAAQNNGETYNICKAYDQTPPNSRLVSRSIPQGFQKRKSEKGCAKVARKGSNSSV